MLNIKVKRLSETATLPTYGSTKAAGMDLYADLGYTQARYVDGLRPVPNYVTIRPHTTVKIGTGWAVQPPDGYCGLIFARSGLATKQGLRPANCVGLCDEDYTGEYIVAIHNDTDDDQIVHHGDRIAQLVFLPYEQAELYEVDELNDTARGCNGFGSTDFK